MTREQSRLLWLEQGLGCAVANFVINGAIAWLMGLGTDSFEINPTVIVDTLLMAFFLPLCVCLITTPLIRKRVRRGELTRLTDPSSRGWAARLPAKGRNRAVVLGLVGVAVTTPVALLLPTLLGRDTLTPGEFVVLKGTLAGVMAFIVGPIVGVAALAEDEHRA